LEAEIFNHKDTIEENEMKMNHVANRTTLSQIKPIHAFNPASKRWQPMVEEEWRLMDRRRNARKSTFEKIKLVIYGIDDGH
jgi:hypothetical protein